MTDDINRFVEMAAILEDRLPLRERVIEAQQKEIAKLNHIITLLVQKIESFSTLLAHAPGPVVVDPPVFTRRTRSLTDAICERCGEGFYAAKGFRRLCRACRGLRVKEGIAFHRPPWHTERAV
jgi:formylmethanofuran dehydrogenase subunit E